MARQGLEPARSEGACVVHEEVEPRVTDPLCELGAMGRVGDVTDDALDLGQGPELLDDGPELLGTSGVEDEPPAPAGQGPGQRTAQTERPPGDECGLHENQSFRW